MSAAPEVKSADATTRATAISTIVLGFAADPMTRWVWPEPSAYLKMMPRFVSAFGGRAFAFGTADITEGVRAAALWLPPGIDPDEEEMGAIMEASLRPEIAVDIAGVAEGMAKYHPREPHWYLPLIVRHYEKWRVGTAGMPFDSRRGCRAPIPHLKSASGIHRTRDPRYSHLGRPPDRRSLEQTLLPRST